MIVGDVVGINWCGNISPQFKLAVILGPSRVQGKLRIRVWLHAPRRWSNAAAVEEAKLYRVNENRITPRHAGVLRAARAAASSLRAKVQRAASKAAAS